VDVLITHAPPRGVGDEDDPPHRGFTALHGLVRALRPPLLLHGHVQPRVSVAGGAAGTARLEDDTMVRNVTGWHLIRVQPAPGGGDAR
jgi:hypothetical protein